MDVVNLYQKSGWTLSRTTLEAPLHRLRRISPGGRAPISTAWYCPLTLEMCTRKVDGLEICSTKVDGLKICARQQDGRYEFVPEK
jgi:hypothetical protein